MSQESEPSALTDFHKHNYAVLALHLLKLPETTPEFTMYGYGSYPAAGTRMLVVYPADLRATKETHCNTTACAMGNAVYVGIEPLPGESWDNYGLRCFAAYNSSAGMMLDKPEWRRWRACFHPGWPDLPHDAAKRIAFMLEFPDQIEAFDAEDAEYPEAYEDYQVNMEMLQRLAQPHA